MLVRGDLVPHFTVTTLDGRRVRYVDLWQQRKLVLVVLDPERDPGGSADHAALWEAARGELGELGAEIVITGEAVAALPRPGMLLADQWGEIYLVGSAQTTADLPGTGAVRDWLEHLQHECPECQGEAR